jgi:formylglycine-generating enzyme required for sulfatase activity/cephalosporin-C deacetylase-like acetyl esterase
VVVWKPVAHVWRQRIALSTDVPEMRRLVDRAHFVDAFARLRAAERYLQGQPILAVLRQHVSTHVSIHTQPSGASISYARYGEDRWHRLGESPLIDVEVPRGLLRWKFEKAGYATQEDTALTTTTSVRLVPAGSAPPGMVRVLAPSPSMQAVVNGVYHGRIEFDDFWFDRHEVTNRQFAEFVEAGGYRTRSYWQPSFIDAAGRELPWEVAMRRFVDRTGRPGPAGWVLGRYPAGQDDLPVTGVSWFEAAAFAAYAGKHLPTLFQWQHVAGFNDLTAAVMTVANFSGKAARPVNTGAAVHRFGARDLAGNVKEWVFNASGPDTRYLLGGAWDEPPYLFAWSDARTPWDRGLNVGFRCALYDRHDETLNTLRRPIPPLRRDYSKERAADDAVFEAYVRAYAYDRRPVNAARETLDASPTEWVRETVSFPAAYGSERVPVHLFLPKRATPPFQAVVFMPGAGAVDMRTSQQEVTNPEMSFVVASGRALVFPIYRGTYERPTPGYRGDTPRTSSIFRDHVIDTYKDLARTIDYLGTRPDIDMTRVAYLGASRGAALAPIYLALEPRFRTAVLYVPGFYADRLPPEIDAIHFAPRVRMPVLMMGGRYDFIFPEQTLQVPFFESLGATTADKRRIMYETGHNLPRMEMIKETLDWLDRYLGPVGQR